MTELLEQSASLPESCPFLVQIVPSDEGELQAQAMENWFAACASDEPFALELFGTRREQGFLLRASSQAQLGLLSKQFQAQYPQAEIEPIPAALDPLLLHPGEHAVVGTFALTLPSWMPIKTFPAKALTEVGGDPLTNLLAAMDISEGRIVSQLALVHAPDNWVNPAIRKAVEHPLQRERDQFAAALKGSHLTTEQTHGRGLALGFLSLFVCTLGARWYQAQHWLALVLLFVFLLVLLAAVGWWRIIQGQQPIYDMKLIAEKLMRSAFYVQLRVIVIGHQQVVPQEALQQQLAAMEIAYRQFALASANRFSLKHSRYLRVTRQAEDRLCLPGAAFPSGLWRLLQRGWSASICNSLELAGLFHLPQQDSDLPLVRRLSVKHLLFSPEVAHAIEQRQDPMPPVMIGVSSHRHYKVPVLLPFATLFTHKFLIGRSRYGKSVLLQQLIGGALQPMRDGSRQPGLFVIDPHRDLIFDVLKMLPADRAHDVLLLDFTATTPVVGLNPLDATMGLSRDQMIASLLPCFERIWEKYWGPRMAFFLKNILLCLITLNFQLCAQGRADEQYTLLDINPVLQYRDYATLVLNQLDQSEPWHQELLAWFANTYWQLPTNSSLRQEIILPILSKMAVFQDNVQLRRIFGQSVTTAAVGQAVTAGKIVLCALSARDMDEASVNVLGSTLINTLHYTFLQQQATPLEQRRPCLVCVDELQNFTGSQFAKLSSEDAKWGCSAVFTTQNLRRLNQLQEGLQETLLSNCDNLFVFNVSAADAKVLESELHGKVSPKHILSQPRLHCYARLSIAGFPQQIASVQLTPPLSWQASPAQQEVAEQIVTRQDHAFLSAEQADRRHEAHLTTFLDVRPFANMIKEQAKAIVQHRARREQELLHEAELLQETDAATSRYDGTGEPGQSSQTESDPSGKTQEATTPGTTGKRKHQRSRRMNRLRKSPVGTPFPGLQPTESVADADDPHPFSASTSKGVDWGREGRERERGA